MEKKKISIHLLVIALVVALAAIIYYVVQYVNLSSQPEKATAESEAPLAGGVGDAAVSLPPEPFDLPSAESAPNGSVPTGGAGGDAAPVLDLASEGLTPPPLSNEQAPELEAAEPAASSAVVSYNGSGYIPAVVEINKGESVTFVNQSSREMWPASAVHPTHTAYPTTGGCNGSTFDACSGLENDASWNFTFDEAGRWNYHDHLNPSVRGIVVVK